MLDDGDDRELPVAVLRPRRLRGQAAATRGELGRWAHAHARALRGRRLAFVLTGGVFCAMLLAMGYVADKTPYTGAGALGMRPATAPAAIGNTTIAPDPWAARISGPDDATRDQIDHLGGVLRTLTVTPRR